MSDVDNALYNAFGQRLISTIYTQANQYRVVLEHDVSATPGLAALNEDPSERQRRRRGAAERHRQNRRALRPAVGQPSRSVPVGHRFVQRRRRLLARRGGGRGHPGRKNLNMPRDITTQFRGDPGLPGGARQLLWLILAAVVAMYIVLGVLCKASFTRSPSSPPCRPPGVGRFSR